MKAVFSATLALLAVSVYGRCPNDCSKDNEVHGDCQKNAKCSCYRNWGGSDCSLKVCPSFPAFIDQPIGDINGDGKIDMTVNKIPVYMPTGTESRERKAASYVTEAYSIDYGYAREVVIGKQSKRQFWDEAHFPAVCSNKGLCNTVTGKCVCFPGYTGPGCERTECPKDNTGNQCSGHGVCKKAFASMEAYTMWDKEKTFKCACDKGYTGPDCSKRECNKGADPVRHNNVVVSSVQKISFMSYTASENEDSLIDGTMVFTITVTDDFGDEWKTAGIPLTYTTKCAAGSCNVFTNLTKTEMDTLQQHVHSALKSLPNDAVQNLYVWVTDKDQTVGTRSDCGDNCNAENKLPKFIDADNAYRNHMCGGDVAKSNVLLKGKTSNLVEDTDGANITKVKEELCLFVSSTNDISTNYRIEYQFNVGRQGAGQLHEGVSFDVDQALVSECKASKTTKDGIEMCLMLPHSSALTTQKFTKINTAAKSTVHTITVQDVSAYREYPLDTGKSSFNKDYAKNTKINLPIVLADHNKKDLLLKKVEFSECSKRGLCDYTTGKCSCFGGFSRSNCSLQSAIGL